MIEELVSFLSQFLSDRGITFFLGMLPISEVRGAIPFGIIKGLGFGETYLISVIGNLSPILPLLLLFEPATRRMEGTYYGSKFLNWLFERTRSKSELVQRYEAIGLALFVAIPLPLTGAWSGVVAAYLFGLPFRRAFPAITGGVLLAGGIVSLVTFMGKGTYLFLHGV